MSTYDLTRTGLENFLAANQIDVSTTNSIIKYLQSDGLLTTPGSTVAVQESGYPPFDPPPVQVLIVDSSPAEVATNSALKVIVDIDDATLAVTGGNNVLVAMSSGNDSVDLSGTSGNDVVIAGPGNDTVTGGSGADSIYGDGGNDSLMGSSGNRSLIDGGNG
ncbi:MAG TPA: calcium-binding protein, partial [Xanthobacteraceae bacterium]|nr:calcium-binding protein [Xanthobacteraceae bacterium]